MASHPPTTLPPVLRVNQLDSNVLDSQLFIIFKEQFRDIFRLFPPGLYSRFGPEFHAILQFLLLRTSLLSSTKGSTFGQQYLNLVLCGKDSHPLSLRDRWWYALLLTGIGWAEEREHDIIRIVKSSFNIRNQAVSKLQRVARAVYYAAKLTNFVLFLLTGRIPSLVESLLGYRFSFIRPPTSSQQILYDTFSRELLWNTFSELIVVTLPLIKPSLLSKLSLTSLVRRKPVGLTEYNMRLCPACGFKPTHPHKAMCNHSFCYYCVRANLMADSEYKCPLCAVRVGLSFD